jgi:hypothetical protein
LPLPLHQIAPRPLTAQQVLATLAVTDGECSHDHARQIAELLNAHGGNLTRACPGWHQPHYRPFLAYAHALLCERDPAELGRWLITCAGDEEANAASMEREADSWVKWQLPHVPAENREHGRGEGGGLPGCRC